MEKLDITERLLQAKNAEIDEIQHENRLFVHRTMLKSHYLLSSGLPLKELCAQYNAIVAEEQIPYEVIEKRLYAKHKLILDKIIAEYK